MARRLPPRREQVSVGLVGSMSVRGALLQIIREFKPEGVSDLDAALNLVCKHADTIRALMDENDALRALLAEISARAASAPKSALDTPETRA